MPSTYTLISANTVSVAAATVTLSAIPSTFTDLAVRISVRCSDATVNNSVKMAINALTSNYSETWLYGNGTTTGSSRFNTGVGLTNWEFGGTFASGASGTANTFSNAEIYIPNYAGSTRKIGGNFGVQEENASTNNYVFTEAFNNTTTAAITSLTFTTGGNFVIGSSFYLYGISKS
jgi:hypothetical protein